MTEQTETAAPLPAASAAEARAFVDEVRAGFSAGTLAPYLGPGVLGWQPSEVPSSHEALAEFLGVKLALPKRARGNL
ncbi:MAG: SIR2 family protein, partial [Polyangiales bacterium]